MSVSVIFIASPVTPTSYISCIPLAAQQLALRHISQDPCAGLTAGITEVRTRSSGRCPAQDHKQMLNYYMNSSKDLHKKQMTRDGPSIVAKTYADEQLSLWFSSAAFEFFGIHLPDAV